MMIRFNVKNFLTFAAREDGKSEEFSMLAGKIRKKKEHVLDDGNIKLLKFAAIYGANAAGKSRLVKAMHFMQCTIVNNALPQGHRDLYCKANSSDKHSPTYFEMEIKLGKNYYTYGFEVLLTEGKFLSEWLIELHNNGENVIFSRDIKKGEYQLFDNNATTANLTAELRKRLEIYAEDIQHDDTTLFLPTMNQNKRNLYQSGSPINVFRKVFFWFKQQLDVSYPQQPVSRYDYLANAEEDKVTEVCRMLESFGTGITDCHLVDVSPENIFTNMPLEYRQKIKSYIDEGLTKDIKNTRPDKITMVIRNPNGMFIITIERNEKTTYKAIRFQHNSNPELFNINEESDGTVRLFDLMEILLTNEKKTYVIDELDRCLHPSLTYHFVKTYLKMSQKRNIQLIVTTHESRLMDFDLLRQDEIWLINKNKKGTADIYSLDEYNIRFDKKVDKAYLEGRYGGVPLFSTLFPVGEA